MINNKQSYIAIRKDNFVDGACFTESEDTQSWLNEMEEHGFKTEVVKRGDAKRLLFTHIDQAYRGKRK